MAMCCFSAVLERKWFFALSLSQALNNRLQRTVMDKVPRHIGQRSAAEPGHYADSMRIRRSAE
jgi:hypothetical protein